eukprot:CAMPEP_0113409662 /NCGR_PEP_ID=MMETSP0013_2-20120614/21265_1 /TAXON_ID=2843 ORGANISM="Skeletonema costatum, Strain 1716" /NCGR_SAMPLE_ID=MMETSP0013_2 /ASSEMBLY_ACC=CAM_ASM_000158 /LENGTH=177 /DNA_ID=CAMNT_0000295791 /DNA_START=27 /DNA_END=560 /DNA_ORIENTATION=+ /assembly_acc=CAM_ASM_000158
MKASLISTPLAALWLLTITHQAHARPDAHQQFEHTAASGDIQKKKKIDRHKQRKQIATDTRQQISSGSIPSDNDFHKSFHQRQIEKQIRLDQLHAHVSETLTAHNSGQRKLSDAELESHTKKQMALERKRKSLQEETPERYLERMKRQEEKLVKKVERKERRKEERFRMMMDRGGEL